MFVDDMKKKITEAMKAKDTVAKDVLRTALGEMQTASNRSGQDLSDEEAHKIVKKLIKSNDETLKVTTDPTNKARLEQENVILSELLPKAWTEEQIAQVLASVEDAIKNAKADGPAMGLAMKELKRRVTDPLSAQFQANAENMTLEQLYALANAGQQPTNPYYSQCVDCINQNPNAWQPTYSNPHAVGNQFSQFTQGNAGNQGLGGVVTPIP